jgi:peptide/nickel transport system substrate-binding protein
MRTQQLALASLAFLLAAGAATADDHDIEVPMFREEVRTGRLPGFAARLPERPRLVPLRSMGREPGRHGGTMRMLMGDARDTRMMVVYGYARLVTLDPQGRLVPDILESFDVAEGRIFTLRLRPGHRWSDGHPFTSADFRYWWESVANNRRLNPGGAPAALLVGGKPPTVEFLDEHTIRYAWDAPNPAFLPGLAAPQPTILYMPAHYMRRFHVDHAPAEALQREVRAARVRDWGALHERKARWYRPENPDLPVLDPWRPRTNPPSEYFVFERNPYFHRVDENGRQLPYVDRVTFTISSSALVPAKVGAGEADLQARYLRFDNYTFLRENAARQNYDVRLWLRGESSFAALLPNLNAADEVWRDVLRDVRVRRALSIGINRRDINRVIFFGLAREANNALLQASPLYEQRFERAWAQHDVALANRLLDEAGLGRRALDGIRLLPDGRRMEITVETAGENSEHTDILELVGYDWWKIGVRLFVRSSQRDVFRRRIIAGQTIMSIWTGWDNGVAGPETEPDALAPTLRQQFQWPQWGLHFETGGREGQAPDQPEARELVELLNRWRRTVTREERVEVWRRMLEINADQVYQIGIVNSTAQPVVTTHRLRNVPRSAIYSYEPGGFFGVQLPDTFWFATDDQRS